MTSKNAGVSLADLNARKASEVPFEFEYTDSDGDLSGLWFSVIGSHSDTITKAMVEAVDADNRKEMVRAAKNAKARPESADIGSFAETIDSGTKQAARRLVGWRQPGDIQGLTPEQAERFQGVIEPWSPENALLLCRSNPDLAAKVMKESNELGNWFKVSPPTS